MFTTYNTLGDQKVTLKNINEVSPSQIFTIFVSSLRINETNRPHISLYTCTPFHC